MGQNLVVNEIRSLPCHYCSNSQEYSYSFQECLDILLIRRFSFIQLQHINLICFNYHINITIINKTYLSNTLLYNSLKLSINVVDSRCFKNLSILDCLTLKNNKIKFSNIFMLLEGTYFLVQTITFS